MSLKWKAQGLVPVRKMVDHVDRWKFETFVRELVAIELAEVRPRSCSARFVRVESLCTSATWTAAGHLSAVQRNLDAVTTHSSSWRAGSAHVTT